MLLLKIFLMLGSLYQNKNNMIEIDKEFLKFCEKLGKDSTFVQGAGGNISIKDGEYLYIKGSGKWISNAVNENIFAILLSKNQEID